MLHYIARRLAAAVVQVGCVLVITFILVRLTPGDPVDAYLSRVQSEASVSPQYIASARRDLGLDRPVAVQFWRYIVRIARGDLGVSFTQSEPVVQIIREQAPFTIQLSLASLVVSVLIGIPLGVYAALHRGGALDYLATVGATLGYSLPRFWIGMVLILVFAVGLGLFPVIGVGEGGSVWNILSHLWLPAATLGLSGAAYVARMTRSSMLEVLGDDYVRTARAKGVSEPAVVLRHGLRNALIPVVTVIGLSLGQALGGSAVIETLFGRVGMGSLLVSSITERDYALVQGTVLVFALGVFVANLAVDVAYAWLNPRIRFA